MDERESGFEEWWDMERARVQEQKPDAKEIARRAWSASENGNQWRYWYGQGFEAARRTTPDREASDES